MTDPEPTPTTPEPHWWDEAAARFEAWLSEQPAAVQEMDLLDQIELYAENPGDA